MTAWTEARARGADGPELDRAFHLDVADFADLLPETGPVPRPRVLMRDPSLPHQIRLNYSLARGSLHRIAVQCNCGRLRRLVDFGENAAQDALGHYRKHLAKEGQPDDRRPDPRYL